MGLKFLSRPKYARFGNFLSASGMLFAVVATLLFHEILSWPMLIVCLAIGSIVGTFASRLIAMTSMPEMVAIFNGLGGGASLLVGWSALFYSLELTVAVTVILSVLIGGVTFSGSVIAWGKLGEWLPSKSIIFLGQRWINGLLLIAVLGCTVCFILDPSSQSIYLYIVIGLALTIGILAVLPIGGADMPVVISLLNSYSGIAACAAGFAINNVVLIVSGSLVGAAGFILTSIMCKAMNRSLVSVLFSGFGASKAAQKIDGEARAISVEDVYYVLEGASSVVIVPGYGMAVAQAQHVVRELGALLEDNGTEVSYAIHPVAGRMPGHMNVLLAEANVSYEQLIEMDVINPRMAAVDVAVVIGANDVVNPSARDDSDSPIYGMPIINVDEARIVLVLKRSLASGFAGVDNPLFFAPNTRMLFGDAKASISAVVNQFKT